MSSKNKALNMNFIKNKRCEWENTNSLLKIKPKQNNFY